ncbi:MAG: hypothetical protein HY286_00860 [Planctomycetes bacterium]|nr:hypothetical protein [Planctomycetota bacterium]
MEKGTLHRAADWLRRAIQTENAPPDSAQHASAPARIDAELLEVLSEELGLRAAALRCAMRGLESPQVAPTDEVRRQLALEIEQIEELVDGLSALATPQIESPDWQSIELTEAFRRAIQRHETRSMLKLPVRVRGRADAGRVRANPATLVRTLALCLDATELVASPESAIIADLASRDSLIIIDFRPMVALSVLPARSRERIQTMLALASRLSTTFGATLECVARESAITPSLRLAQG